MFLFHLFHQSSNLISVFFRCCPYLSPTLSSPLPPLDPIYSIAQSNSASAALSAELSVMRASVSEAQSRAIEAEEAMSDAVARCEAME